MGRDSHSAVQKVLIIDDSATNRLMLAECLQPDYAVLQASSGDEGLELAREHQQIGRASCRERVYSSV